MTGWRASCSSSQSANADIQATDAAGKLLCSAREITLQATVDPAQRAALFASARTRRRLSIGSIYADPSGGQDIIPTAYPITHGMAVVGFVYAGLRVAAFAQAEGAPGDTAGRPVGSRTAPAASHLCWMPGRSVRRRPHC